MKDQQLLNDCLEKLSNDRTNKVQCSLTRSKKIELNIENNQVNLLRTTLDSKLFLTIIKDGKKANLSINSIDKETIAASLQQMISMADSAEFDPANTIAPKQKPKRFISGPQKPDLHLMYYRLKSFMTHVAETFPQIILQRGNLSFTSYQNRLINSNDINFKTRKGVYHFFMVFLAKNGPHLSSLNYTSLTTKELDQELIKYGSINMLLKLTNEFSKSKPIKDKFTGEVVITPDCLNDFVNWYIDITLRDSSIISGASPFKDKINQSICSNRLSLYSRPISPEIADNFFYTSDGYEVKNIAIVEGGVLKNFLLSPYGASKTGQKLIPNINGAYIISPGRKSLPDIIKSMKKGILLSRFSGGRPTVNGDFSGVAKNSFYIENGAMIHPMNETMISGNLLTMFQNIEDISTESINFGYAILPWLLVSGMTIWGKEV